MSEQGEARRLSALLDQPASERRGDPRLLSLAEAADAVAARWSSLQVPPAALERVAMPRPAPTRQRLRPHRGLVGAGAAVVFAVVVLALIFVDGGLDRAGIVERAEAAITPQGIVYTRLRFVSRTRSGGSTQRLRGRVEAWADEAGGRSHLVVRALDGRLAADIAIFPGRVEAYTAPDDTIRVTRTGGESATPPVFGGSLLTLESLRGRLGDAEVRGPLAFGERQVYELELDRPPAGTGPSVTGTTVYVVDADSFEPVTIRAQASASGTTSETTVDFESYRVLDRSREPRLDLLPHPGARRTNEP